eukprot:scaffold62601_cov28-Tisochrysis_lutea.AAC.1
MVLPLLGPRRDDARCSAYWASGHGEVRPTGLTPTAELCSQCCPRMPEAICSPVQCGCLATGGYDRSSRRMGLRCKRRALLRARLGIDTRSAEMFSSAAFTVSATVTVDERAANPQSRAARHLPQAELIPIPRSSVPFTGCS